MNQIFFLLSTLLPLILTSLNLTVAFATDCETLLGSANDNSTRFLDPPMKRLIPIAETQKMFQALNAKECPNGPAIFERVIRNPPYLAKQFPYNRVAVTLRLYSDADGLQNFASIRHLNRKHDVLGSDVRTWMGIRLGNADEVRFEAIKDIRFCRLSRDLLSMKAYGPITDRRFAEVFLRRRSIYHLLGRGAEWFSGSKILEADRVSVWNIDRTTAELALDLDGLSHAEFATVLNEVVVYLDDRSRR